MFKNKVFLASRSPRRRELIFHLFNNVEILDANFEEPIPRKGEGEGFVRRCVEAKWEQSLPHWKSEEGSALLVADTMVALRGKLLGKPRDKNEARAMLRSLSGQPHEVHTAFRLARREGTAVKDSGPVVVVTEVSFHKLSETDLTAYLRTGESMDKAGAYGFQELGLRLVEKLKGSYTNVIGLPVLEVAATARRLGFEELP